VFAGLVLFFAGITSSLAMGTPWMGFMRDEFGWSKIKELGLWTMILVLGLPTVILRKECLMNMIMGWNGKFSCFAMFETILFSWILEWTKDGVKSQVVLISKSQIFINLSLNT
jgi:SNF family Na+-dependent transporter